MNKETYNKRKISAQSEHKDLWLEYKQNVMNIKYAIEIEDKELEKNLRSKRKQISKSLKEIKSFL